MTVANGNEVSLVTASGSGSANINISDISENGDYVNQTAVNVGNKDVKFSLKTGDVVRTVITKGENHTEASFSVYIATAGGTTTKDIASNSALDNTITMTSDMDVGAIGMWCGFRTADVVDMKIEIYVNDVRYV